MRKGHIILKPRSIGATTMPGSPGAPAVTLGVVDWFNPKKGFGFINVDGLGQQVFVHFSAIRAKGFKELSAGNHVEFELVANGDRWRAKNVTLSFHRAKEAARS